MLLLGFNGLGMLLLGFKSVFKLKSQCLPYEILEIRCLNKKRAIHPVNPKEQIDISGHILPFRHFLGNLQEPPLSPSLNRTI